MLEAHPFTCKHFLIGPAKELLRYKGNSQRFNSVITLLGEPGPRRGRGRRPGGAPREPGTCFSSVGGLCGVIVVVNRADMRALACTRTVVGVSSVEVGFLKAVDWCLLSSGK